MPKFWSSPFLFQNVPRSKCFFISCFDLIALQMADGWWTGNTWVRICPPPTTKIPVSASRIPIISLNFSPGRGNNLYEQLSKRFIPTTFNDAFSRHQSRSWGAHYLRSLLGNLKCCCFCRCGFSGVAIFQLYSVHTPGSYHSYMISSLHHWYTIHTVFYSFVYFLQLVSKTTVPLWLHQLEFALRLIKKLHMSNWKNTPGCLGYLGDHTTYPFYRDYVINHASF